VRALGDTRVGPTGARPARERTGCTVRLVEAKARLGRLLLDDEKPAARVVQIGVHQIEPGENDVRIQFALEDRALDDLVALGLGRAGGNIGEQAAIGRGFPGEQHRVRIAADQLPTDQQDELPTGAGAARVLPQRRVRPPGVDRRDIRDAVEPLPEEAPGGGPLVGWQRAPEILAVHLVIQPDHEAFDETRVGLQQRDRVGWNNANARHEAFLVEQREVPVRRRRELRRDHDAIARGGDFDAQVGEVVQPPSPNLDHLGHAPGHHHRRVDTLHEGFGDAVEIEGDEHAAIEGTVQFAVRHHGVQNDFVLRDRGDVGQGHRDGIGGWARRDWLRRHLADRRTRHNGRHLADWRTRNNRRHLADWWARNDRRHEGRVQCSWPDRDDRQRAAWTEQHTVRHVPGDEARVAHQDLAAGTLRDLRADLPAPVQRAQRQLAQNARDIARAAAADGRIDAADYLRRAGRDVGEDGAIAVNGERIQAWRRRTVQGDQNAHRAGGLDGRGQHHVDHGVRVGRLHGGLRRRQIERCDIGDVRARDQPGRAEVAAHLDLGRRSGEIDAAERARLGAIAAHPLGLDLHV